MTLTRILDVSNSSERPNHRGCGGLRENSIVTMLKKYSIRYGCKFVDSDSEADVIFTNDVYPKWSEKFSLRRVKRMDGVYWKEKYVERNEPLNAAAKASDMVIFISEYSHQSYHNLYGNLGTLHEVVLNWCDGNIFNPTDLKDVRHKHFIAVASSWERKQKRFNDIKELALNFPNERFVLIGKLPKESWPTNMYLCGEEVNPNVLRTIVNRSAGFINLSHRDAAPKVVAEATSCGLPIFYADSGGVPELVQVGVRVLDENSEQIVEETPSLNKEELIDRFDKYLQVLPMLQEAAEEYAQRRKERTYNLLGDYFSLIKGE